MSEKLTEGIPKSQPEQPVVHLHLTRRVYIAVLLMLIAPWALLASLWMGRQLIRDVERSSLFSRPEAAGRLMQGNPGPWGTLEYVRIAIEPPEELVFVAPQDEAPSRWVFKGFSKEKLADLFISAGLPADKTGVLLLQTTFDVSNGTAIVSPTPEFVQGMAQELRRRIYGVLAGFPENEAQRFPFTLRSQFLDERFDQSGLSPQMIADIKRMLYPHQDILLFADINVLLPRLADHRDKVRLLKTLARKNTLLAELKIDEHTKVDKLVSYWAAGGRAKDIGPLLESLRRVPGGATLDITHLLPQFARRRIYTYPYPSGSTLDARKDCHWTSLNFFNSEPDDRYADPAFALKTIETGYYPISSGARLGDLVLLVTPKGQVIHSAVYVADNIAFTKNGAPATQPWVLMKIDDLVTFFSAFYQAEGDLGVMFYRKREG